jgi:von Willebrand factor type A domain
MANISHPSSAFLLLALVASGCGGKGSDSQVNGGNGESTGASAGAVMIGTNPNGSGGTGSGTGPIIDPNSACAKGTANATLAGVNMFVMFDRSSSMNQSAVRNGPSRWQLTSAALSGFFASSNAAGLNLALRFFPHDVPTAGCNNMGCDANACAMPLVGLGALTAAAAPTDTQEKALLDATLASPPAMSGQGMGQGMSGGTPIYAALAGALQWASAQHKQSPGENNVVVLVTDGQPNGCDTNIGHIAKLAADAFAADGTRTYTVGLTGSRQSDMDQIAMAGGTTKGIFVADGANTTQDLLDALAGIRGAILDCDFPMPQPKPGVVVDPSLINVNLTPSSGTQSTLAQVSGEANCMGNSGWYYDNPGAPTRIVLCKSTCDSVTADPMASLEILLGCPTNTDIPK